MPHFSDCCPGRDTYICQVCARIRCSGCQDGEWLNLQEFTGIDRDGNVCPNCLANWKTAVSTVKGFNARHDAQRGLEDVQVEFKQRLNQPDGSRQMSAKYA